MVTLTFRNSWRKKSSSIYYMLRLLLLQIELVNDKIGMAYSGMGPDFR